MPCWPLGNTDFVSDFLRESLSPCKATLTKLACIIELQGLASIALHVAMRLLRYNMQSCWAHLWRFLPPPSARPFAQALDTSMVNFVREQLAIPTQSPLIQDILRASVAESALHFLSGAIALQILAHTQKNSWLRCFLNLSAAPRSLCSAVYQFVGHRIKPNCPWLLLPTSDYSDAFSEPRHSATLGFVLVECN